MQVTLMDATLCPEQVIGRAAAQCYASDTSEAANINRVQKLMELGHFATLRFAYATFHLRGSRAWSHQMVRVAHAGILQKSQRYVMEVDFKFVTPPTVGKQWFTRLVAGITVDLCRWSYRLMIWSGIPKEDARFYLPEALETEMVVTGNFQMWTHWLALRTEKHAQWEIREVAEAIEKQLHQLAPNVFGRI